MEKEHGKEIEEPRRFYARAGESGLILVGYIAFLDPPKESAAQAIAMMQQHGVPGKVLTGDNDAVKRQICSQVGMEVDRIVLGSELERMSEASLALAAAEVNVFAKLSPEQKARVIGALRERVAHVADIV